MNFVVKASKPFEKLAMTHLTNFSKSNPKHGIENGKLYPPFYCYRYRNKLICKQV